MTGNSFWWKECVFYQIYPKSFCDSNGDGVGDIPGIISKLDYLRELGVGALWICPIYPSPGYDNGYDISDYESIDATFGTMEDFERLISETHARGMRLIIDMVVNHSSDMHPWFRRALADRDSPERDYFIWREPDENGAPPNNWGALFGGSAWTRDDASGQYYLGLFSSRQPDLNWANPKLRREVYGIMRRWLERGADGFRLDVISLIAKPEDWSDGPVGRSGNHDPRGRAAANPAVHEYLREMRREVFDGRDVVAVGEAAATGLDNAVRFTSPDSGELDMVFQFEHMNLDGGETFKWNDNVIPVFALKQVMTKWQLGLSGKGWNALFWDNHDQPRMLSRLGDEGQYRERSAKMLAVCLHLLQGTPFVYQGEELGMVNMSFTDPSQLRDSESINALERYTATGEISREDMLKYISLKSRDTARTPMQWNSGQNAGFTAGTPWMDINPNYTSINAAEQETREDSVLSFYKKLIRLRMRSETIVYGEYAAYMPEHPSVFAYTRRLGGELILVCCNFSRSAQRFPAPIGYIDAKTKVILGNFEGSEYMKTEVLAPFEALVLTKNEEMIQPCPM